MKFLVDAQLPKKLSRFIIDKGFESIHTLDLPKRNNTSDTEIIELSINLKYIVIRKMLASGTFINKKQNLTN